MTSPIAAYSVSDEYAMVTVTAQRSWIDERTAMLKTLASMKRAGADVILIDFAKEAPLALRG